MLLQEQVKKMNESEFRFDAIFNNDIIATCILEFDTLKYLEVNKAYCSLYNYRKEEFLAGMTVHDITGEKEASISSILQTKKEGSIYIPLRYHKKKDGTVFQTEILAYNFTWNGKDGILAIIRDITEQKLTQDALKQERDLFSSGPVITFVWENKVNWLVKYVSANVTNFLGFTPEEILSNDFNYLQHIHPEDIDRVKDEVEFNLIKMVDTFEQSYRVKTKTGEYKWFYDFTKIERDSSKNVTSICGYLFDESKLKQTEISLKEERRRLSDVIKGTNAGTWEWNIQSGETIFNQRWAEIIGYSLEEISPISIQTWIKFVHPDDLKKSDDILRAHLKGESDFYECEARMKHKNGDWVWVLDKGKIHKWDKGGNPLLMSGSHMDITLWKKTEEALRESEEKFYKAFHFSPVAMSLSTLEGVILDVNDEFLRLAERTRDEVVGNNTLELNSWVHPEQRDFIISKVRNSGKVQNVEVELRSKSSKIIPLLFAAEIVVMARKEFLLFSALDISTRKAAEEKINKLNEELEKRVNERTEELFKTNLSLQESETKYRTIVDFTHDWEYWISAEGNYNYVSPSCEKITGYAAQEFLDDNNLLKKITHPDDLDFLVKTSNAKLLTKESCEFEFRIITKSGDVRWISYVCQPVFGMDGEFLGKRGSNRDITERKAVEDELKLYKDHLIELVEIKTAELEKSKETFRALSENTNDAIIRFKKKFQHLYVNKATEELTGIPVNEFIGKTFSDLDFPPKLVKNFEISIQSVFQLKKKNRIELKSPNGVWIDWLLMPEFDSNGDVDSVITSGRDITERKQMQLSLQKNFKKEHELNELKDRFISMVSHEFRTPLTSILSSSDFLEMEIENLTTAQKTKYFDKIRRNVEHMINMLNEILFINKIDSSKIHQNYEKIDLPQFCEELFNESKIIYPGINSIIENKLEERFHNIDAVMMRNILGNLFSNAFKYNQENGAVIFTLSLEKDRLIYNVCDTGIGIPLEEQKNVFESFTRMSNARHIKGTGLGLSIVKKSVEQLEGKISFTSKENEGSRFIVTIPIR